LNGLSQSYVHNPLYTTVAKKVKSEGYALVASKVLYESIPSSLEFLIEILVKLGMDAPLDVHVEPATRSRLHDKLVLLPWNRTLVRLPLLCYYRDLSVWPQQGRQYQSLGKSFLQSSELIDLLLFDLSLCPVSEVDLCYPIEVGLNLIKISASPIQNGISPPNRPHQDGESFVLIHLIERCNVVGGESQTFDLDGTRLWEGTLVEPFDTLVLDDNCVLHHVGETSVAQQSEQGHRTVLVVDLSPMRSTNSMKV
jgi:hypothetical protein